MSAVDWVTGRRAGAPELPTREGDAPAAAERRCHRAHATGPLSEQRARPPAIDGWVYIYVGLGVTSATRVSWLCGRRLRDSVCAFLRAPGMTGRYLWGW